jgi:hypothetical protein
MPLHTYLFQTDSEIQLTDSKIRLHRPYPTCKRYVAILPAGATTLRMVGYLDPPYVDRAGRKTHVHGWASKPFADKRVSIDTYAGHKGFVHQSTLLDWSWDAKGGIVGAVELKYRKSDHDRCVFVPLESCVFTEYFPNTRRDGLEMCEAARITHLFLIPPDHGCNTSTFLHLPNATIRVREWQLRRKTQLNSDENIKSIIRQTDGRCLGSRLELHFPKIDFSCNRALRIMKKTDILGGKSILIDNANGSLFASHPYDLEVQ